MSVTINIVVVGTRSKDVQQFIKSITGHEKKTGFGSRNSSHKVLIETSYSSKVYIKISDKSFTTDPCYLVVLSDYQYDFVDEANKARRNLNKCSGRLHFHFDSRRIKGEKDRNALNNGRSIELNDSDSESPIEHLLPIIRLETNDRVRLKSSTSQEDEKMYEILDEGLLMIEAFDPKSKDVSRFFQYIQQHFDSKFAMDNPRNYSSALTVLQSTLESALKVVENHLDQKSE